MVAVATALNGNGKNINGKEVTPKVLNTYLMKNHGYQGNLFVWGSIQKFGLRYYGQTKDIATMKKFVCQDKVVILNIDKGGHWVISNGINSDGSFNIIDGWKQLDRTRVKPSEVVRAGIYELMN